MLAKRLFDITVAVIGMVLVSPVLLLLAIVIKLDSRGPAMYRARRIGRMGRPFYMYKFRTMVIDADRTGPPLSYLNDPRVTHIGRFLRKTRLDELPQFLNVLKGDMSIVGPRPEAPEYVDRKNPLWNQILSVRPGMCGMTQLSFAFDEAILLKNQATVSRDYVNTVLPVKLQLDLEYIRCRSLLLDLRLLLQTIWVLIRGS